MTEYTVLVGCVSFVVKVLEDINIPPSFRFDAASDVEYHGDRETHIEVVSASLYLGTGPFGGSVELTRSEINDTLERDHRELVKQTQWMIDQEDRF